MYCSKRMWIVLLIFITLLLYLLYVLFSKTRFVTFVSNGCIIGTFQVVLHFHSGVMVDPGLFGDVQKGQLYLELDAIDVFYRF